MLSVIINPSVNFGLQVELIAQSSTMHMLDHYAQRMTFQSTQFPDKMSMVCSDLTKFFR